MIATLVWGMVATVLSGISLIAILSIPTLSASAGKLILIAAGISAIAAIPIAWAIGKRMGRPRAIAKTDSLR